jgi:hypothetical protein
MRHPVTFLTAENVNGGPGRVAVACWDSPQRMTAGHFFLASISSARRLSTWAVT